MSTRKTTQPTAADAYTARSNDIARLIDILQMEMEEHAEQLKEKPRNWGLVGDLDKVRSDLVQLVAFMSRMDPEEVEEFLADAD